MECVQYIVVRKDLNIPPGKLAAQVSHASLGSVLERKHTLILNQEIYKQDDGRQTYSLSGLDLFLIQRNVSLLDTREARSWFEGRFTKLVVYVKSKQKMLNLSEKLIDLKIINKLIYDACNTVLEPEEDNGTTLTCMGIEPIEREKVPKCLKTLRLLD